MERQPDLSSSPDQETEASASTTFAYVMTDRAANIEQIVAVGDFSGFKDAKGHFGGVMGLRGGQVRVLADLPDSVQQDWHDRHPDSSTTHPKRRTINMPFHMTPEQAEKSKRRGEEIAQEDRRYEL